MPDPFGDIQPIPGKLLLDEGPPLDEALGKIRQNAPPLKLPPLNFQQLLPRFRPPRPPIGVPGPPPPLRRPPGVPPNFIPGQQAPWGAINPFGPGPQGAPRVWNHPDFPALPNQPPIQLSPQAMMNVPTSSPTNLGNLSQMSGMA